MPRRKKDVWVNPYMREQPTRIEPITTNEEIDALEAMSGQAWRGCGLTQFGIDCKRMLIRDHLEVIPHWREMSAFAWAQVTNKFYGHYDTFANSRFVMEKEFMAAALLEGVPLDYELKLFKLRFKGGRKLLSAIRKGLVRAPVLEPELIGELKVDAER